MTKKLKNDGWIDLDEVSQSHKNTQAFTKVAGHFEDKILKQDFFKSEIVRIRNKFHIEVSADEEGWDFLVDATVKDIPLDNELTKLCKRYDLDGLDFIPIIRHYLFHNELKYYFHPSGSLCLIEKNNELEDGDNSYPVIIRINPYANKPDILDFVDKVYNTQIEPLQRQYAKKNVNVGSYRKTDPINRKISDFCFENQNLPRKVIADLISDKFGKFFDAGEIGKIISLENIMRKQL